VCAGNGALQDESKMPNFWLMFGLPRFAGEINSRASGRFQGPPHHHLRRCRYFKASASALLIINSGLGTSDCSFYILFLEAIQRFWYAPPNRNTID
jgi:hypothetical protein